MRLVVRPAEDDSSYKQLCARCREWYQGENPAVITPELFREIKRYEDYSMDEVGNSFYATFDGVSYLRGEPVTETADGGALWYHHPDRKPKLLGVPIEAAGTGAELNMTTAQRIAMSRKVYDAELKEGFADPRLARGYHGLPPEEMKDLAAELEHLSDLEFYDTMNDRVGARLVEKEQAEDLDMQRREAAEE